MTDIALDLYGLVDRADAIVAAGAYRVRSATESGELVSPWPGVLVAAEKSAHLRVLVSAAMRHVGPAAVVAGQTAAWMHGCASANAVPVHVIVPYEHPRRSRPGLVMHNGPLPDGDVTTVDGLAVLTPERVTADVLCRERPHHALAITDELLARLEPDDREPFRVAVGERLRMRRDNRGTVRGARLLRVATGRAESPPESWLLFRVVDAGFPVPEANWVLTGIDGEELYRLDLAWPQLRIAIEYHGYAAHIGRTAEDEARAEDLRRRGWLLIEVWADQLFFPSLIESELDEAFRRRGVDTGRRRAGALQGRRHREPRRGRRPSCSRT